ncbi:pyk1, partial [Symbiodinium necroappetens]
MYRREDINVSKLLTRLPKAVRTKVLAKEFVDECWAIFKKYDVFQHEKLEGVNLWKALLEALPESFSQAILKNQHGWALQQDSVYGFTGCGREGEPAISLIKFPEYVKFTLALILHKYSVNGKVLDCKMALKSQELDHSKRKTKIVASLGPASWSEEMIPKMIEAGTDIFRLNCSHRRGGDFERVYPLIRKYARMLGRRVEVLGDLQGPKFRVGELAGEPVPLVDGEIVEFGICKDDNDLIKPGRITMKPTKEQLALVKACKVGIDLLIEDGIMKVNVVEKISDTELKVKVVRGGKLKARKGVNVPDCEIDCAALTEKDIEDAEYLLQLEPPVEYICVRVSFAQKGQDLQELIDIMDRLKVPAERKICPKIEKPQALTNIEGIIEKSQALMVARGDLGVELELERVPFAQKLLIARAKKAGLFVINATQMVESMIENPVPTRAEVSDLQNAVFDGCDAVMLSGEAASGKYPCESVKAEADAVLEAETVRDFLKPQVPDGAIVDEANKPRELDDSKRATKVVASLGPASWSEEMIPKMIEAGTDIFRLNCSHRRGGDFERVYPLIRKYAKEMGKNVQCLGDLQGPKFRVGELAGEPVELKNGDILEFGISKDDNDNIRPGRITMKPTTEQTALVKACKPGTPLLLEDGIMEVKVVEKCSESELKVEVTRGGKLKARKGVNVPDVEINCAALTAKDIEDAEFLLQLDPPIEYICVSFAQKGQDLQELIDIMDRLKVPAERRPKICPKIEKPQAFTNIEGIIAKSQALMVARGDLGVELGLCRVPFAQKLLIQRAKQAGLFVITATQMVESMIENPVPTRAEVSDLMNAVWDGTDAVMLSGEAASGKYPCEAVLAEASATREAETVKHRLQQACPFVAINSKMPLRPPKMLNCGMGLKRQETDHSKRKTK